MMGHSPQIWVFSFYLFVDTGYVPVKAAFSLELFEADIAIEAYAIVFSVNVHIASSGGSKIFL